ncbi:FMN-dependent NADH-azoreductase [Nitrincola iocasae]|uniref:FMN dependent NADH:quinone oxidoreductase n=1 Tax=Nitrincola iocasae TaxID=2614693 RepID=A0A5J6LCI8_9GAMM|nr:NAD(P)H-dependent oxidoreductase [Nitrincola iocasae]QEW06136.1 FMN-dependent NADH-azoreductase [Nitrincola iocasae]
MKTLLHVKSSIFGDDGQSVQLADRLIKRWLQQNPEGQVVVRDLAAEPIAHFDMQTIAALSAEAEQRSPEQQAIVALSDQLITELQEADVLVLAAPMYNFAVPSQLKAWFDQIAKNGVTFRYTEQGPVGLLQDRPVYVLATRGGQYREAGLDFQVPWIKLILGFVGLKQVEVVYAEGLNMAGADVAIEQARVELDALTLS